MFCLEGDCGSDPSKLKLCAVSGHRDDWQSDAL